MQVDNCQLNYLQKSISHLIVSESMILMGYVTSLYLFENNIATPYRTLKINCDPAEILEKYKDNPLIKEFIYDVLRKNIVPKILIDYVRKPLINKNGLYFRLTFDSDLKSSKTNTLFPSHFMSERLLSPEASNP